MINQQDFTPRAQGRYRVTLLAYRLGEVAALSAALLLIDENFFGGTRYWGMALDPFLLLVLLISVQYGAGCGVLTALAATAVLLTGPLPAPTLSHDLYAYSVTIAQRPVLWLMCAIVLGAISDQHIRRGRRLAAALKETDQQRSAVTTAYQEAQRANEALVLRLNNERMTLASVSRAVRQLLRPSINEVVGGVDDLIALTLGARKFSLYVVRGNGLEVVRWSGWNGDNEYTGVFGRDSPLFKAIAEQRRLLCITNPLDEVFLHRDGLIAGPVCDPGTGRALGMLKVEDLDFIHLGAETLGNFRIAAEWIGFAMAGAQAPHAWRIEASGKGAQAEAIAVAQRPVEATMWSAGHAGAEFVVSVVSIRLQPFGDMALDTAAVRESVRQAIHATLLADCIIQSDELGVAFLLIVPGASADIACVYAKTLEPALRRSLPSALQNVPIDIREKSMLMVAAPLRSPSLVN